MRTAALALLLLPLAACDSGRDDAVIVAYSGPEITEADALVEDIPGRFESWSADVVSTRERRTVAIGIGFLCGDECNRRIALRFEGRGDLPESVAGTITTSEFLPERFEEARIDIDRVEIQDWGPEVYSGVVYPASRPEAFVPPLVFWTDERTVAAE